MEFEQSQNFNDRLSQWVANQGFWFQIRYSMIGAGTKGTLIYQLVRMSFRVLVFLLILSAAIGVFLVRRTGFVSFHQDFKTEMKSALNASEVEVLGLERVQGNLWVNGLACKGDKDTFYSSMEARNIRCTMRLLDGLVGRWDPGVITMSRLQMEVRAGADDDQSAKLLGDSLFKQFPDIDAKTFEIADASIRWGYGRAIAPGTISLLAQAGIPEQGFESEHTRGSILNSFLRIQRTGEELRFSFKGGKLSQNWLEDLDIVELVVVCTRDRMLFEKASFKRDSGTVDFSGLTITTGARPILAGMMKINNLSISGMVPPPVRSFVEGSLSGDFRITGSTNSSEGIVFEGNVRLDSGDIISVRDQIHLLQALSVVDFSRNYHRIDFHDGTFHLKTEGGGMEVTDLSLKSEDNTTLEGKLKVRLPNLEETKRELEKGPSDNNTRMLNNNDDADLAAMKMKLDDDFTLKRAALAAKREREGKSGNSSRSLFVDQEEILLERRRLEAEASIRLSKTLRYEGLIKITLLPDSFERAPKLAEKFPVDPESGRVPMMIPIEGSLFEITLKQAEDIYQQGKR